MPYQMNNNKYYNKILFIVLEKHMMGNYTYLDSYLTKLDLEYRVLYLPEYPTNLTTIARLRKGKSVLKKICNFMKDRYPNGLSSTLIFYSNSEGFVLSNKELWMPRMTNCREVMLQHGLMPLNSPHKKIRSFINLLSRSFWGFNLLGKGFGGNKVDYIIVWGQIYKKYLVDTMGWNENHVFISGRMLKPRFGIQRKMVQNNNNDTALFLLQDYASLKIVKKKEQEEIFISIANLLSKYYKNVIVRKHPKMKDDVYSVFYNIPNIIISHNSLEEDLSNSNKVYSFTSSALIDAYMKGKEIVSISFKGIQPSNFLAFGRVVALSDLENYLRKYHSYDDKAIIKTDFFCTANNMDGIVYNLLEKSTN